MAGRNRKGTITATMVLSLNCIALLTDGPARVGV